MEQEKDDETADTLLDTIRHLTLTLHIDTAMLLPVVPDVMEYMVKELPGRGKGIHEVCSTVVIALRERT